ncbi:hypothetical protein EAH80_07250 [Mycobacterium hodleri]|uniref:Uncharacterized protein n=1 Tax=Mycolicibacterium hodleri TaxID=49897 RepID=A0A502EDT6_9MYCO|nr:hypothetical protein EAH80_07250 [Mycolicibacterium hodleri]
MITTGTALARRGERDRVRTHRPTAPSVPALDVSKVSAAAVPPKKSEPTTSIKHTVKDVSDPRPTTPRRGDRA